MKKFIPVLLMMLSGLTQAAQISIIDIEENLIFTSSGEIFEAHSDSVLELARVARDKNLSAEVTIDNTSLTADIFGLRNTILKLELKTPIEHAPEIGTEKDNRNYGLMSSYVTNLSSEFEVERLFNSMRRDLKGSSECYNRAHAWSWELYSKFVNGRRVQTGKMWLFFTKRYIKEYRYKWWFHVSPYLDLQGEPRVIDRAFADMPLNRRNWTNMFMANEANCPKISVYSDYRNHQYDAYCYTIQTSVFYWQPWQVEANENQGSVRDSWNQWELKKAYRDTRGWFARVPDLQN